MVERQKDYDKSENNKNGHFYFMMGRGKVHSCCKDNADSFEEGPAVNRSSGGNSNMLVSNPVHIFYFDDELTECYC